MTPLQANQLDAGYGKRLVLKQLSLETRAGEVLVLTGPNGAGKTTLLRALARLLRPRGGVVALEGKDIWKEPARRVARRLAVAPQSEPAEATIRVEDAVLLGRAVHRGWLLPYSNDDRQIAHDIMERVGLTELRDRLVNSLSGGEWRRVLLARALAQQPRVLLLDEPMAHLDLKYQMEILTLLRQLAHRDGLAIALTMHDLQLAALGADRLALLAHGKLVALGKPTEVLHSDLLQQTYGLPIEVRIHPVYGTPLVVPLFLDPPPTHIPT